MDTDVGILPIPIYAVLLGLLVAFSLTGHITGEIAMVIAIMAIFAFTLGEIGKRLPGLRHVGSGAVCVTLVPSFMAYHGWIPAQAVHVVADFFKSTNVLGLFIAAVIVGSILSMDRTLLIKGFAKIFAPLLVGSVVATIAGTAVGTALGLGCFNTLFFIVVPIMSGGVGEGAIPLSIGYAAITGLPQGDLLARVLPSLMVGNLIAVVIAGSLNYLGKLHPRLSGAGQLQQGAEDLLDTLEDTTASQINVQNVAAALMTAITLYLCGVLAFQTLGFPAPVVMLLIAVLLKLTHAITPRLQAGSQTVYKFCITAVAYPMLFAFSIVLTPWNKLVIGFSPANLITVAVTVGSLVATGFFVGRWVSLYPVESAIVTSTHAGMGGAGDIAILTASNRMRLMPFAQIATRIAGGLTVLAALLVATHLQVLK